MHDDEQGHGLGPTRARVLALLQDAGRPLTAREVAERLGLHANSVRFHLDALEKDADLVRDHEPRSTPGRPSVTYTPTETAPQVARRRYHLLARVLAASLHEQVSSPGVAAEQAGRAWSRSLPVPPPTAGSATGDAVLDVLTASLDEVGFESRAVDDADGLRIEVSHCPFLEVAADFEDVVCGLHLGLMRGVAERMETPVQVERLEPLVEPSLCLAHLSR